MEKPITGAVSSDNASMFGVFDGMGGEEQGEMASLIAAKDASKIQFGKDITQDLKKYCMTANESICQYADDNMIFSMGTTAAILVFAKKEIVLCNIGDSKVFRISDKKIEQISFDHVAISVFGKKPPLSQNLGIPPDELKIEPYLSTGKYHDGDLYLICSDGLTDMVETDTIAQIATNKPFEDAAKSLLETALKNGGKDNITLVLIKV